MRYLLFSAVLISGFAACNQSVKGKNGVSYKSAVQYNDYIVGRQTILMKNIIAFGEMAQPKPDSAKKMLDVYAKETINFIKEIKGMPPYKGDSSLRDAAINSFTFYKRVFEDDYKQILQINENMTEEGSVEVKKIVEDLGKEEEKFDKAFHNAQKDFADKNNMKLMENKMQKEVDKLNN